MLKCRLDFSLSRPRHLRLHGAFCHRHEGRGDQRFLAELNCEEVLCFALRRLLKGFLEDMGFSNQIHKRKELSFVPSRLLFFTRFWYTQTRRLVSSEQ